MLTYHEVLKLYEAKALELDREIGAVKLLFVKLSKLSPAELYSNINAEIPTSVREDLARAMDLYLTNNIPVQYILNEATFFGYDFIVDSTVLIPRYETEELVENILYKIDEYFANYTSIKAADIGTGSGAIAISLKLEEEKIVMFATDISTTALKTAKMNANKLMAEVNFLQGDMLEPLTGLNLKFDLLISNPPYISSTELIESIVIDNEPTIALFGGTDGLDFYRSIFANAKEILAEKALLAFEIGYNQAEVISKLVKEHFPKDRFEILKDINGKSRMLFIYYNL